MVIENRKVGMCGLEVFRQRADGVGKSERGIWKWYSDTGFRSRFDFRGDDSYQG